MTKEMDAKIVTILEEFIWALGDTTNQGKSLLAKLKVKLAEALVLAVWPGPSADFIVIAGPDGKFGEIDFNSERWVRNFTHASLCWGDGNAEEITNPASRVES